MRVANLSSAVISTPVPVETAKLYSCLTCLQSTLFNAVCISAISCIIIGCLLADLPSAVYENKRVIQLKTSQIEMKRFFISYMCTLLLHLENFRKQHANRKSTSKSRKHFHQFDSRWWKCSQHKQIKKNTANAHNTTKNILFAARFFFWLCCEHLQRVCCQIEEVVFLICRCFFYLQRVELSRPPYIFPYMR